MSGLLVVAPGLSTTVQDFGRRGFRHVGVPDSGAADPVAMRLANLLVGNAPDVGVLEAFYVGPTLRVETESARFAVVGPHGVVETRAAGAQTWVAAPLGRSLRLEKGGSLRCRTGGRSASLAIAVEGGLRIAPALGSVATLARGAIGGWQGRALRETDLLPLNLARVDMRPELEADVDLPMPTRLRVMPGPQADYFTPEAFDAFLNATYAIANGANRMGMRLEGAPVRSERGFNITSDAVAPGAIQIPGDGLPIILGADAQTTGGYPKIAAVISADLPALARLPVGARLSFACVGQTEAVAARRAMQDEIEGLPRRLRPVPTPRPIEALLLEENLIGGVVDARAPELNAGGAAPLESCPA